MTTWAQICTQNNLSNAQNWCTQSFNLDYLPAVGRFCWPGCKCCVSYCSEYGCGEWCDNFGSFDCQWLSLSTSSLPDSSKIFKRISSAVKLKLTKENKVRRLQHVMLKIDLNATTSLARRKPAATECMTLFDEAHVDEKWFFPCHDGESYFLMGDEEDPPPERCVKHKSHIAKVMFLCAMAQPRHLPNGTWWDGKLGIWPLRRQCTVDLAMPSCAARHLSFLLLENGIVKTRCFNSSLL